MPNIIKFYVCDDDRLYAKSIKNRIDSYMNASCNGRLYSTDVFYDGKALLDKFSKEPADVIFLDINLNEMSGFEIASVIQKQKENVLIIFITIYDDKVYQSYEYHPFWFIRKSHSNDFESIIHKIIRKVDVENEKKLLICEFNAENKTLELNINTLLCIESFKNNIIIKDKSEDDIKVRCKIASAEQQLYPFNVIRIQNGILVNCKYISKITSREVILSNGMRFGISRLRVDYVKNEYQNYVRRKLI